MGASGIDVMGVSGGKLSTWSSFWSDITLIPSSSNVLGGMWSVDFQGSCQGASKTGSIQDIWVPAEL